MAVQPTDTDLRLSSRRGFLKRAGLGLAALAAMSAAVGRIATRKSGRALPGQGSLFEPRREDILRHWRRRFNRFRLR